MEGVSTSEGEQINIGIRKKPWESNRRICFQDYPIGLHQESYSLLNDLKERKMDMTFAQALELVPKLRKERRNVVSSAMCGSSRASGTVSIKFWWICLSCLQGQGFLH